MSNSITERIVRPMPERPVQSIRPAQDQRAEALAAKNQAAQAAQDKISAARNSDKGRYVDRYA